MHRKIKPIDANELFDTDDINRTTIKGELRKLYPAIHQKLSTGGWSARDMVKWLDERGLSMSVELFRVYLRDLDKEHGYSRSAKKAQAPKAPVPTPPICPGGTGGPGGAASTASLGNSRPSILSNSKGIFSDLKPSPADGMVDLTQKGERNGD